MDTFIYLAIGFIYAIDALWWLHQGDRPHTCCEVALALMYVGLIAARLLGNR